MKNKVSSQVHFGLFAEIYSKVPPSTPSILPTNRKSFFAIGQYGLALNVN